MGHGAWGIGHPFDFAQGEWALGIGHWAWGVAELCTVNGQRSTVNRQQLPPN
ncbi:hypothetical protein H6G33_03600 [Calothrix sp. FACHB-1219]|uniref:hypothetical protein n=1 Tax=unclassified Calothrix TaxID=2619626 RepID=UPI00168A1C46|nr:MULTISPECIES: hypothetical protein [unclassified Calothrix]MBD2202987.1 hypothetical protein [Calothrix sp. FACHB-168]MBD2216115.1 hypothetical protein [Calothrix sp. FACHB-1219]